MDYYQQNNQPTYTPPKKNTFAVLSCIFGIASLALLITGIVPIPLGALGILFAVLSRRGRKMESTAKTGVLLSAVGLATGLFFIIMVYALTLVGAVPGMNGENYKEIFEQYGIDYDAMMDQMYDY